MSSRLTACPSTTYGKPEIQTTPVERIGHAEAFFKATGADIRYRGDRAFYSNDGDYIQMPSSRHSATPRASMRRSRMNRPTGRSTLTRLDRSFGRKAWGDEGYAREELVAELASAFLCADLGITPEVRDDHASYIANWLTVLKNDKRAIFSAAAHAQKAVDFLHGQRPKARPRPRERPSNPARSVLCGRFEMCPLNRPVDMLARCDMFCVSAIGHTALPDSRPDAPKSTRPFFLPLQRITESC